jgi:8-oxo-dGTP pyrophosphatase MutT (NUDIX family)
MTRGQNILRVSEIATTLRICPVAAPPTLKGATQARVDALWAQERERGGDEIYNGRIFAVTSQTRERIEGYFTDYNRYLAQRRAPELFDLLRVKPLAVSALLSTADQHVVFARRNSSVSDDAQRWELAPSGGFGPEDQQDDGTLSVISCAERELAEELNIPGSAITTSKLLTMVYDETTHAYDIGVRIEVQLDSARVIDAFAARTTDEYSDLALVPSGGVGRFVARHADRFVGVSKILLEMSGLLGD